MGGVGGLRRQSGSKVPFVLIEAGHSFIIDWIATPLSSSGFQQTLYPWVIDVSFAAQ
jgi:hypothetical protein